MEKLEYVYWMPTNEPSFVLPYQHQFQIATVIKAVKGQKMDSDIYFSLLSDRVQRLINENETDAKPLSLIDAFRTASLNNPDASKIWLEKLESVTIDGVTEVFERIPEERISNAAKEFAIKLLETNRRRLLELKQ